MLVPLPALVRCADPPGSVGLPWNLASGRGNPQHRSPGRTSQKKQPQTSENKLEEKTHSGALGGGCLSPRDPAVAGDRWQSLHQPNNWQLPGNGGRVRNTPCKSQLCGRRSCSISKFWAGHFNSHPPPTFPSFLKILSRAKEKGTGERAAERAPAAGDVWPALPAGGEACDSTSR